MHPECGCATSALYLAGAGAVPADRVKILSTGGMLDAARASTARSVLVATEVGMLHQLRRAAPEIDFRAVNDRASCRYMKMITPDKLLRALREGRDEVHRRPGAGRPRPGRGAADDRDRAARAVASERRPGRRDADLVVVGSGVAGLTAALDAAELGLRVVVVTKDAVDAGSTRWAQGGVAVVLGDVPGDSVEAHVADTLAAGAGLCDAAAVASILADGPAAVARLRARGAVFDPAVRPGRLARTREGGHSAFRVVHAGGDATGAEVERRWSPAAGRPAGCRC